MAGPWEQYQQAAPAAEGPWAKYASAAPTDIVSQIPGMPPARANVQEEKAPRRWQDYVTGAIDRKSTRLNSSHSQQSRMPSSA